MNQTTLNLLAHVLPAQPLRQWVLTVPFPLREPLAYEPGLMALLARVFEDSLLPWFRSCPGIDSDWHPAIRWHRADC